MNTESKTPAPVPSARRAGRVTGRLLAWTAALTAVVIPFLTATQHAIEATTGVLTALAALTDAMRALLG